MAARLVTAVLGGALAAARFWKLAYRWWSLAAPHPGVDNLEPWPSHCFGAHNGCIQDVIRQWESKRLTGPPVLGIDFGHSE
jgi:hypothetical protein